MGKMRKLLISTFMLGALLLQIPQMNVEAKEGREIKAKEVDGGYKFSILHEKDTSGVFYIRYDNKEIYIGELHTNEDYYLPYSELNSGKSLGDYGLYIDGDIDGEYYSHSHAVRLTETSKQTIGAKTDIKKNEQLTKLPLSKKVKVTIGKFTVPSELNFHIKGDKGSKVKYTVYINNNEYISKEVESNSTVKYILSNEFNRYKDKVTTIKVVVEGATGVTDQAVYDNVQYENIGNLDLLHTTRTEKGLTYSVEGLNSVSTVRFYVEGQKVHEQVVNVGDNVTITKDDLRKKVKKQGNHNAFVAVRNQLGQEEFKIVKMTTLSQGQQDETGSLYGTLVSSSGSAVTYGYTNTYKTYNGLRAKVLLGGVEIADHALNYATNYKIDLNKNKANIPAGKTQLEIKYYKDGKEEDNMLVVVKYSGGYGEDGKPISPVKPEEIPTGGGNNVGGNSGNNSSTGSNGNSGTNGGNTNGSGQDGVANEDGGKLQGNIPQMNTVTSGIGVLLGSILLVLGYVFYTTRPTKQADNNKYN